MDNKKQYNFFQYKYIHIYIFIIILIMSSVISFSSFSLMQGNENEKTGGIILLLLSTLFILGVVFVELKIFSDKISIDNKRIILKGLFGIKKQCYILETVKVYKVIFLREGTFIVITDSNDNISNINFSSKKTNLRFEYSKRREDILKQFWHGQIIEINNI